MLADQSHRLKVTKYRNATQVHFARGASTTSISGQHLWRHSGARNAPTAAKPAVNCDNINNNHCVEQLAALMTCCQKLLFRKTSIQEVSKVINLKQKTKQKTQLFEQCHILYKCQLTVSNPRYRYV